MGGDDLMSVSIVKPSSFFAFATSRSTAFTSSSSVSFSNFTFPVYFSFLSFGFPSLPSLSVFFPFDLKNV